MRIDAAFAVQFAVVDVFLFSVAGKLYDPVRFARGVLDYEILSPPLAYYAASLIIIFESLLAASHLTNRFVRLTSFFGLILLLVFLVAVSVNLAKKRKIPCHCFGYSPDEM